jgi:hypothetical protein
MSEFVNGEIKEIKNELILKMGSWNLRMKKVGLKGEKV